MTEAKMLNKITDVLTKGVEAAKRREQDSSAPLPKYSPNNLKSIVLSQEGVLLTFFTTVDSNQATTTRYIQFPQNEEAFNEWMTGKELLSFLVGERVYSSIEEIVVIQSTGPNAIYKVPERQINYITEKVIPKMKRLYSFVALYSIDITLKQFLDEKKQVLTDPYQHIYDLPEIVEPRDGIKALINEDWWKHTALRPQYYLLDEKDGPLSRYFNKVKEHFENQEKVEKYKKRVEKKNDEKAEAFDEEKIVEIQKILTNLGVLAPLIVEILAVQQDNQLFLKKVETGATFSKGHDDFLKEKLSLRVPKSKLKLDSSVKWIFTEAVLDLTDEAKQKVLLDVYSLITNKSSSTKTVTYEEIKGFYREVVKTVADFYIKLYTKDVPQHTSRLDVLLKLALTNCLKVLVKTNQLPLLRGVLENKDMTKLSLTEALVSGMKRALYLSFATRSIENKNTEALLLTEEVKTFYNEEIVTNINKSHIALIEAVLYFEKQIVLKDVTDAEDIATEIILYNYLIRENKLDFKGYCSKALQKVYGTNEKLIRNAEAPEVFNKLLIELQGEKASEMEVVLTPEEDVSEEEVVSEEDVDSEEDVEEPSGVLEPTIEEEIVADIEEVEEPVETIEEPQPEPEEPPMEIDTSDILVKLDIEDVEEESTYEDDFEPSEADLDEIQSENWKPNKDIQKCIAWLNKLEAIPQVSKHETVLQGYPIYISPVVQHTLRVLKQKESFEDAEDIQSFIVNDFLLQFNEVPQFDIAFNAMVSMHIVYLKHYKSIKPYYNYNQFIPKNQLFKKYYIRKGKKLNSEEVYKYFKLLYMAVTGRIR